MSVSVTEATAINVLVRELFVTTEGGDWARDKRPTKPEVVAAAKLLAGSANKRLMAGVRPEHITPRRRRKL